MQPVFPASEKAVVPKLCFDISNSVAISSTTAFAWQALHCSVASLPSLPLAPVGPVAPVAPWGPSLVQEAKIKHAAAIINPAEKKNFCKFFILLQFLLIIRLCSGQLVQIVSGTKILKFMKGSVNKSVRFVNIITDISQFFIDICQYVNDIIMFDVCRFPEIAK